MKRITFSGMVMLISIVFLSVTAYGQMPGGGAMSGQTGPSGHSMGPGMPMNPAMSMNPGQAGQGMMMGGQPMGCRCMGMGGQGMMMGHGMGMGGGMGHGMMAGGMMGHGMMGGGQMMGHGRMRGHGGYLSRILKDLTLDENQKKAIYEIKNRLIKDSVRKMADIRIARIELKDLLGKDPVDMKAVEAKVKQIGALRTEMHLACIKALQEIKAKLPREQLKKLGEMMDGSSMLAMMEMTDMMDMDDE
jgi:hypothetical protein